MRAGMYLALVCLFFGAALAAFVSGSLESRLGTLFCFGLMPAAGFYGGGYLLGQLLVFGVNLCDTIIARSSQYATRFAQVFITGQTRGSQIGWPATFIPRPTLRVPTAWDSDWRCALVGDSGVSSPQPCP
jgi:hypothetical protein